MSFLEWVLGSRVQASFSVIASALKQKTKTCARDFAGG